MLDFLISWAEQLIVALIIIIMIEMIIPNSNNRKYIKIVLGIFILYIIFNPIIKNKLEKIDFGTVLSYEANTNETIENQTKINYENQIENVYEEKFKNVILEDLHQKGYDSEDIQMDIKFENNEIQVNKLYLKIKRIDKSKNNSININEIKIEEKKEKIDKDELDKLKTMLSNTYNIEASKIDIESENSHD